MMRTDFHLHTSFSDGKNTPEEMVAAALQKGMTKIGFSDHSLTEFDVDYCMKAERIGEYKKEIATLKEKYKGKIEIYCGIEQDIFSSPAAGFDYVIGSVHYVKAGEDYIPVDLSTQAIEDGVKKHFAGDFLAFAEAYFAQVETVVEKTNADIIGHFDLVTKFEEKTPLFDRNHSRYIKAWQRAADKLLTHGRLFEINTGAISRGYRRTPYPSADIITYLAAMGAKFIMSSDSHRAENLLFQFDLWRNDALSIVAAL